MTTPNEYVPPTIEQWHSIVSALVSLDLAAHLEGGGAASTYVWVDLPDGRIALLGDNGDNWAANVYEDREAFEHGADFKEVETDISSREHDPAQVAEGFRQAVTDVCMAGNPALAGRCGEPLCVCNPNPPTNVFTYFEQKLKKVPYRSDGKDDLEGLKQFPLDSECGSTCMVIIDKAADLLANCDTHEHVVAPILEGVLVAVEIVCFG